MQSHRIIVFTSFLWLSAVVWVTAACSFVQARMPTETAIYVDRALLAYDAQQYEQALRELQEALELDYQLDTLYFGQGQYERAAPLLQQVYALGPQRPNLAYQEKNYRRALSYLRANVPSDENFAQLTRFYAGLALGALRLPAEARAEIEESARLQPISPLTLPAQRFGEALMHAAEWDRRWRGDLPLGLFYDSNVSVVPNTSSDLVAVILRQDQKRRDREAIHLFSIAKDVRWGSQPFALPLEYLIDDNRFDLDAYDYDRQVVTVSVTWHF